MRLIRLLKNDIAREAAEWVDEDIISQSQAEQICQRYGVDFHQVKSRSFGYNVLVGLGYLFIGLAIITLLGANWEDIPRAVRMWGLIAVTMTTQGLALRTYLKGDTSRATGIFFLGNLFYGASIILIAQVYHLGEHMPDGVFWWALGCLPIAVLTKSPWISLQSTLLALTWFLMETNLGFYPMLFPLFILGALIVLYQGKSSIILLLTFVASVGYWFEYTLAEFWRDGRLFDFYAEHVAVSAALFILVYVFSHWLGQRQSITAKDYGAVLAVWCLRFGLIFLLVMGFEDPWRVLIREGWDHQSSMFVLVTVFSVGSLLLASMVNRLISVIGIITFFYLTLITLMQAGDANNSVYFQIVSNLVLVGVGVWLIIRGIHSGISHYFFLGVASILLTAFIRYIDLIGDYVGGAVLFAMFAMLLLGAAKYWKNYRPREEER